MNNNLLIYIIIFLISVFISSCSQILLKKEATKEHESFIKEYLNFPVMFAYCMFFGSSLITTFSYKVVPLSMGPILEASGYLWVSILGLIFLKERISKDKLIGLILIIVGIIVFNINI